MEILRMGPANLGWRRDLPDPRDYGPDHPVVTDLLAALAALPDSRPEMPESMDLRSYFPATTTAFPIHTSVACACTALVEYFRRRACGDMLRLSSYYLHQCTQKLLGSSSISGTDVRTTMKALAQLGIPPEYRWPYDSCHAELEPDPFLNVYGREYHSVRYVRLDPVNTTGRQTLSTVRQFLAAGFPSVFGVTIPSSLDEQSLIHYRPTFDSFPLGQAFVAVGYDNRRIHASRGALLFRSGWGCKWGEDGYGWLPYSFIENQLAVDFWTILEPSWLSSGEFLRPTRIDAAT